MGKKYDVGGYSPTVSINIQDMIDKNKKFTTNAKNLDKVINKAISDGMDELCKRAEKKAREYMVAYGLGSSQLYSNLTASRVKNGLYITTSGSNDWGFNYAMYVEFGTGVVGKNGTPHPKLTEQGWVYDKNEHGDSGWLYPSSPDDPNPSSHQNKDGEWWAWTAGQEARPFMYDTWLYISRSWHSTIQGFIRRAFKEWGDTLT